MSSLELEAVNRDKDSDPLTLTVTPGKDVVGIPFNPKVKHWQFASPLSKVALRAADFKSARATFRWPTLSTTCEYDQIGLLFVRPLPGLPAPDAEQPGDAESAPYYIKYGLEVVRGQPIIAVAESNHLLDWSTWPTTPKHLESLTIEFLRYGSGLLARLIPPADEAGAGKQEPTTIRLFTWPLANLRDADPNIWICIYVSRPDTNNTATEGFSATFDDFQVETVQGSRL
ncbi:uncharacterized protein Z519_09536 [Cladophialophora bantiana CBS 173.52]|uniref:Uncharacterized protein n=1 Tax=Cladophialophora bantiana (strain ATCC 10958 / CBS 173.52 / CDC B-1940 / NIH 8579) TaxID=1442370 RepID=A0A0D2HH58_CLAB1|nr:uncharacterized protein Z519_09536 [Cladophialophora bantiana CBS 173.52]KIW90105.1 hypothetical protein Z519_09536 [Cladophialophora bantiana CBS 173.52]